MGATPIIVLYDTLGNKYYRGQEAPSREMILGADPEDIASAVEDYLIANPPGAPAWGDVTGTLSDQTDLNSALDGKSSTGHSHTESDISDLDHTDPSALHDKADVEGVLTGEISTHTHAGGGFEFPVGFVYMSMTDDDPSTTLGYGTWEAFGPYVPMGIDLSETPDEDFDTAGETGGEKEHTLLTTEMPEHAHDENCPASASGGALKLGIDTNASGNQASGSSTASVGGGLPHNNMPPFKVLYAWVRTA